MCVSGLSNQSSSSVCLVLDDQMAKYAATPPYKGGLLYTSTALQPRLAHALYRAMPGEGQRSGINTAEIIAGRWQVHPKATCFCSDDFPTKILPMKQAFKSPNSFRQHVMNTRAPPDGLKTRDVWITAAIWTQHISGSAKRHTTLWGIPNLEEWEKRDSWQELDIMISQNDPLEWHQHYHHLSL